MQRMDRKCFLAVFVREWLALSWPELHLRASQTLIEGGWQINFLKRVIRPELWRGSDGMVTVHGALTLCSVS